MNKKIINLFFILLIILFSLSIFSCAGSSNAGMGHEGNPYDGNVDNNAENGFYYKYAEEVDEEPMESIVTGTGGENYKDYGINPEISTENETFSTFSVDVDTGSYSVARRFIMDNNELPRQEAVRAEEFINYFDYEYKVPVDSIFSVITDVAPSPFRDNKYLLRFGIQGKDVPPAERKQANLVFLIDVSGSMRPSNKLPLIKESLKILLDNLLPTDMVGIAVYAGLAEPYMKSLPVSKKTEILRAIDKLEASGSTNAEGGIKVAYEMVSENYLEDGINRVILCSDGDANVGYISPDELITIVDDYRELGITLSTFGFGMGNYNDYLMEQLANKGDGNYAYIDNIEEAERTFSKKLLSILQEIARDVKVQVEFNKNSVKTFRLIGYENRKLEKEEFRDDKVDAGEVGALHSVTAIYEIALHDGFKNMDADLYTFRIRWKNDKGVDVKEAETKLLTDKVRERFNQTSPYFRLAMSVAEFAEILRGSPYAVNSTIENLVEIVVDSLSELESNGIEPDDKFYELLELMEKAQTLQTVS